MARTSQHCPKCDNPITLFVTEVVRQVACPYCKALLNLGPEGIDVAKPVKARATASKSSPSPAAPPSIVNSTQVNTLALAACIALGIAVVVGTICTLFFVTQRSAEVPSGNQVAAVRLLEKQSSASELRSAGEQIEHDARGRQANPAGRVRQETEVESLALKEALAKEAATRKATERGATTERATQDSLPSSLAAAVEGVRHAVATIVADGVGSGFVVQRRKWLVTNFHVIAGSSRAKAVRTGEDGDDSIDVVIEGFVACDPRKDLVILSLQNDWPAEPLVLSGEKPRLGEDVFAVGTPEGLSETVTRGIVSQIRTAADVGHKSLGPSTKIIQTDAFFTHGSSGGPLCSAGGKVIGINSFGLQHDSKSAEFHFAIAAEELADLLQKAGGAIRPLTELPPKRN